MKVMYKAHKWDSNIEEVEVVKDTSKIVPCTMRKFAIGEDFTSTTMECEERRETDWYKYCETKQEAKEWLLGKAQAARQETIEALQQQTDAVTKILEIET